MNWTLTCRQFLTVFLLLTSLVSGSLAQSITVSGNISPSTGLCNTGPGATVSLAFSTTGAFGAGNVFTLQRSDQFGNFNTPVAIGTLSSAPTTASNLTISGSLASAPYGTQYRFRVVSSNLARTGNQTATDVTIGTPLPGGAGSFSACQNSGNTTLTATGRNLEWFNSPGAVVPNGTGASYSVPTTTNNTYYVTQTINNCRSERLSVVLNLTTPPSAAPTVNGLSAYCPGAGGNLTLTGSGTSFRWVNQSTGAVTNAATIAAPSQTTSYSVSQFNGVCEGPRNTFTATVRSVPGPLTISSSTNSFVYCSGGTTVPTLSVTNLGTGNTVRWTFPGGSNTTSNTVSATQQGTYSVIQRDANNCESSPTTQNVTINPTPGAATVSNTTPAYCPENNPGTLSASVNGVGTSLRWYLPGGVTTSSNPAAPTTAAGSPFAYSVSQLSASNCEGPRTTVTVTVYGSPASAPTINTQPTYCINTPPAALTASGTGLRWYTTAGGFLSNNTLTPPTQPSAYDVRQTNSDGCIGPALRVNVTVNGQPGNPGTTNVALCQNETPVTLSATGNNLRWYTQGNPAALPGAPTPSTSTPNAFTIYEVTQTDGNNCTSNRSTLRFDVKSLPAAPDVGSFSACQNATAPVLTANGSNLKWYDANDAPIAGTPVPPTGATGTTNYKVSQTVNGCEGAKATLPFNVFGLPAQPMVGTFNYCSAQAPGQLTATGTRIRWYNQSGGFLADNTVAAPTAASNTPYIYQVTQTDSRNCQSPFLNVNVTVRATPGAPGVSNPIFCQNRAAQALSATGENLVWFDGANTQLSGAPTPATNNTGDQVFRVTQTNGLNCTSSQATITVRVNPVPGNPTFTQPDQYCSGQTAELLSANGTALLWYTAATGGNGSNSAIRPNTSPNPEGFTSTQTYYVTQTVGSCESERQPITVTIKRKPGLPGNVPSTPTFCQNYSPPVLSANAENGASLVWVYNGRDNATAPVPPNNAATTYIYQVAQTLNGCRGDNASFSVRVKPTPGQPRITPFSLCQGRETRALLGVGTDLKYYDNNNVFLGTSGPSVPTANATTITYKVTQSTDGCEGPSIDYPVTVFPIPAAPNTTTDLQYCLDQRDQPRQNISALTAQGQDIKWYRSDNFGIAPPTPRTNALANDTYFVTQTVNGCESTRNTVNVRVVTTTAPVVSTSLVTYCRTDVAKALEVTAPTGSTLVWFDPNSFSTVQAPGGVAPTPPTFEPTKGGERYQVYAIGTNGCYSARSSIGLVINANPTLGILGSTTINYGQTTTLRLKFTSQPPFSFSLSDGGTGGVSGTATDTVANVVVKPLRTSTYQVASVSNVCGVGLPGNPATAVVNVTIPTIATQALTVSNSICAGGSFVVGYNTTGTFNQGNAFKVQIADTTSKVYVDVSGATTASQITALLPSTLRGGPYLVRVLATNPGAEVPGLPSPTVLVVRGLPSATLTGTQSIYETYPANLSITFGGDGPWALAYTTSDGQTSSLNATTSPYVLEVKPTKTTTYQLVSVSNNCASTSVVSGTAVVTVEPLLAVEDPLTGALTLYPIPTQNILTVAIEMPLSSQKPAELTLSDFTGRPVLTRTTESRQTQLDLSQQPAGLYLLNVQVGDHKVARRVMKL
jgi:hypothetical protein